MYARSAPAIGLSLFAASCSTIMAQPCEPALIPEGSLTVRLEPFLRQATGAPILEPRAWDHANDGSGRIFYIEQLGTLHIIENGQVLPQPALNITSRVSYFQQRGLLGFILHKDFAVPGSPGYQKLYTWHNEPRDAAPPLYRLSVRPAQVVLTEWRMSAANPNVVDMASARELFRADHGSPVHSAGGMFWGNDGYLYFTIGTPSNTWLNGQEHTHPDGGILRIDPLDPALTPGSTDPVSINGRYRIPATNPFATHATNAREIFCWGLRHPYQISIDRPTGVILSVCVGQQLYEEINVIELGGNYGWPYLEANCPALEPVPNPAPELIEPLLAWRHSDGRAATGAIIYRGSITSLRGKMIAADLTRTTGGFFLGPGRLFYADIFDSQGQVLPASQVSAQGLQIVGGMPVAIIALLTDPQNELYIIGQDVPNGGASIYKVVSAESCYADCDPATGAGVLDIFDFLCFGNKFASNDPYACDCDLSTGPGVCDIFDFLCFGNAFDAGCP